LEETPLSVEKNPLTIRVFHSLEDFIIQITAIFVVSSASRIGVELPGRELCTLVF
jgi:hypothetical protein